MCRYWVNFHAYGLSFVVQPSMCQYWVNFHTYDRSARHPAEYVSLLSKFPCIRSFVCRPAEYVSLLSKCPHVRSFSPSSSWMYVITDTRTIFTRTIVGPIIQPSMCHYWVNLHSYDRWARHPAEYVSLLSKCPHVGSLSPSSSRVCVINE